VPRPALECIGGPRCGDRFFSPRLGVATLDLPADAELSETEARLLLAVGVPADIPVVRYRVRLNRHGDLVLVHDGD